MPVPTRAPPFDSRLGADPQRANRLPAPRRGPKKPASPKSHPNTSGVNSELVRDDSQSETGGPQPRVPTSRPTAAACRLLEVMLDSFEKIEIAIALYRAEAHAMPVRELGETLQVSSHAVERGLDELAHAGAVHVDGGLARLTLRPQEIPAMDEIAALYDEDRLLVIRTLTEIAMNKMRGMAARAFADAFQIRRKKEEDGDG